MEYYLETSFGLVTITPCKDLPSSVELCIAGKPWAAYLSADDAACAVASSSTGHRQLDALPSFRVPALLSDWKQSLPHHFTTGTLRREVSESRAHEELSGKYVLPEMLLAL